MKKTKEVEDPQTGSVYQFEYEEIQPEDIDFLTAVDLYDNSRDQFELKQRVESLTHKISGAGQKKAAWGYRASPNGKITVVSGSCRRQACKLAEKPYRIYVYSGELPNAIIALIDSVDNELVEMDHHEYCMKIKQRVDGLQKEGATFDEAYVRYCRITGNDYSMDNFRARYRVGSIDRSLYMAFPSESRPSFSVMRDHMVSLVNLLNEHGADFVSEQMTLAGLIADYALEVEGQIPQGFATYALKRARKYFNSRYGIGGTAKQEEGKLVSAASSRVLAGGSRKKSFLKVANSASLGTTYTVRVNDDEKQEKLDRFLKELLGVEAD
ncbi:hypothetical protein AB4254_09315 [Vibrio breoganii]